MIQTQSLWQKGTLDVYCNGREVRIKSLTITIRFLKSPDDTLLETLSKMSGTRHVSYIDSKTLNIDKNRIVSQTDERVSYTMTTKEVPLLSYNDLANMPKGNSAVFRIGGSPIWNRNQMALPMSYCMYKNPINVSGKKFTLLSVPTTSSALEFDLMAMIPDFDKMLEQRLTEFETVDDAIQVYKENTGLSDSDINKMDADVFAGEIMNIVRILIKQREAEAAEKGKKKEKLQTTENEDLKEAMKQEEEKHHDGQVKRYACGKLSREDIIKAGDAYSNMFYEAFMDTRDDWKSNPLVIYDGNGVRTRDGRVLIDFNNDELKAYGERMVELSKEESNKHVYSEEQNPNIKSVVIRPDFVTWLCELESWPKSFDAAVAKSIE